MAECEYGGWPLEGFREGCVEDVQRLVHEKVPEGHNLEYKDGGIFLDQGIDANHEIASEIASLANSDGGILIVGVTTKKRPKQGDVPTGIRGTKESLDLGRVSTICAHSLCPEFDTGGLVVRSFPDPQTDGLSGCVICVPRSPRAPHMVVSHGRGRSNWFGKYPYRTGQGREVMLDWHVRDVMGRRQRPDLVVSAEESGSRGVSGRSLDVRLVLSLSNRGREVAEDWRVQVDLPKGMLNPHWETRTDLREKRAPADVDKRLEWYTGRPLLPEDVEDLRLPLTANIPKQDGLLLGRLVFSTHARHAELRKGLLELRVSFRNRPVPQVDLLVRLIEEALAPDEELRPAAWEWAAFDHVD